MSDSSDFFQLSYKISSFFLLIPPDTLIRKIIYWVIAIPHFFLVFISLVLESAKLFIGGSGEFSANMLNLGVSVMHLMAVNRIVRWLFIKRNYDVVLARIRKINTDYSWFEYHSYPAELNVNAIQPTNRILKYKSKQMLESKRFCLRLTLVFVSYVGLNIAVSYPLNYINPTYEKWNPVLNKTSVYRDYPYPLWYPFDTSLSDGYYLLGLLYQIYAYYFFMATFFCIDCLCVGTIIHLTSHVHVVGYAFSFVDRNIDPMLNYYEATEFKQKRIIKLIEELNEIYNCSEMLNAVFSGQLLTQELCMSATICCCLYRVTSVPSNTETCYLATMVASAVTEMFVVSWFNENFTLAVFDLQHRIYELEWLDYSTKLRKLVLFLMCRVQKPFYFTMGFGFPLDIRVFVTMIKSSYSFYTLITNSGSKFPSDNVTGN